MWWSMHVRSGYVLLYERWWLFCATHTSTFAADGLKCFTDVEAKVVTRCKESQGYRTCFTKYNDTQSAQVTGRGCSTKDKVFYRECETHQYGDQVEKMCFCSFLLCNGGASSTVRPTSPLLLVVLAAALGYLSGVSGLGGRLTGSGNRATGTRQTTKRRNCSTGESQLQSWNFNCCDSRCSPMSADLCSRRTCLLREECDISFSILIQSLDHHQAEKLVKEKISLTKNQTNVISSLSSGLASRDPSQRLHLVQWNLQLPKNSCKKEK